MTRERARKRLRCGCSECRCRCHMDEASTVCYLCARGLHRGESPELDAARHRAERRVELLAVL